MTAQRALFVLALAAGLVAGSLYYLGIQRVPVVVAAQHLAPGRSIGAADVEVRSYPADAVPHGALGDVSAVLGRYPRAPMWPGQLLLAEATAQTTAAFDSGIVPPTGYRAVAIPVQAAQALGGAVAPGARVDVIAVPLPGKVPEERTTELLLEGALIIDVRGEQGGPFEREPSSGRGIAVPERLGSVVIAIGPESEVLVADRIATSSFVLVLVPEQP